MKGILRIAVDRHADAHVVAVAGEIDLSTAKRFETAVLATIDEAAERMVVLDLTGVTFLSSNGIAALLQSRAHSAGAGVELRIVVAAATAARRSLELTGLLGMLADDSTLASALNR